MVPWQQAKEFLLQRLAEAYALGEFQGRGWVFQKPGEFPCGAWPQEKRHPKLRGLQDTGLLQEISGQGPISEK